MSRSHNRVRIDEILPPARQQLEVSGYRRPPMLMGAQAKDQNSRYIASNLRLLDESAANKAKGIN